MVHLPFSLVLQYIDPRLPFGFHCVAVALVVGRLQHMARYIEFGEGGSFEQFSANLRNMQ